MPIDDIPLSTPLFCVVSERSHSATGNTKLIPAEELKKFFTRMHDMGFMKKGVSFKEWTLKLLFKLILET